MYLDKRRVVRVDGDTTTVGDRVEAIALNHNRGLKQGKWRAQSMEGLNREMEIIWVMH